MEASDSRDRPHGHAAAQTLEKGVLWSWWAGDFKLRTGGYFAIRKFASVCAIEVNTPLSWLACWTS